MTAAFRKRREVLIEGLNQIPGFRCQSPAGAFYAFPNIEGTGRSARELQDGLLNEAGVATVAGTSFGAWGEGYLRFSYANSRANIAEGLDRLEAYLRSRGAAAGAGSRGFVHLQFCAIRTGHIVPDRRRTDERQWLPPVP